MTRSGTLPPALHRPFTVAEGLAAGCTRDRLRGRDLDFPARSIRIPRGRDTSLVDLCRPYLELLPGAVASHTTAARIHGLILPGRLLADPALHLSRPPAAAVPRRRSVHGHRLALTAAEMAAVSGIAVTSVARTWLDLAGLLSLEELVVAGDQIVSEHHRSFGPPRRPVLALAHLQSYLASKEYVPHLRRARAALALVRVGVDSPPETWLRLLLHQRGLPKFTPDHPLCDAHGQPRIWTDLACEQYRTCLEYDGGHHLTPEQQSSDHLRDLATAELGWHQVKISRLDVHRGPDFVVAKVRRGLALGGWTGS